MIFHHGDVSPGHYTVMARSTTAPAWVHLDDDKVKHRYSLLETLCGQTFPAHPSLYPP